MLQALSEWPVAALLRQSAILYPVVNAAHIMAIGLLFGAIVTLDLRLLGLFRRQGLSALARPLQLMAATGLALAALTGFLLFSVRPSAYAENPAFLAKLGLIALALLNLLALRGNRHWRLALADGAVHGSVRAAAAVSLLSWVAVVLAGRWIGFLQ